jgi:MFS family permease
MAKQAPSDRPGRIRRAPPNTQRTAGTRPARSTGWGLILSLLVLASASITAVGLSVDAPHIRHSFGLTPVGVGAIASLIYIGAATSSAKGGRCTDRWGPAPVLVVSMLLLACGEAIAAVAPSAVIFFLGVFVAGLGYGWVNPPTNVVSTPANAQRRATSMSIKQTGIPLGGILAGILIPPLAAAHGWRISLLVPIGMCLVLGGVAARWCPRPTADIQRAVDSVDVVRLRVPRAYAFGFFMGGVQVTIFSFLALYLAEDRGWSTEQAGAGLSLTLLGGLIGRPLWGWLSDRLHDDRVKVLQLTSLFGGGALLLLPLVRSVALPVLLPIVGLMSVGWNGAYIATVAEAAGPGAVGLETGRAMVLVNLGAVLLPPTFGAVVSGLHSWRTAWVFCAGIGLLPLLILPFCRARTTPMPDGRMG